MGTSTEPKDRRKVSLLGQNLQPDEATVVKHLAIRNRLTSNCPRVFRFHLFVDLYTWSYRLWIFWMELYAFTSHQVQSLKLQKYEATGPTSLLLHVYRWGFSLCHSPMGHGQIGFSRMSQAYCGHHCVLQPLGWVCRLLLWFQRSLCKNFHPDFWGNDPIRRSYFFKWVENHQLHTVVCWFLVSQSPPALHPWHQVMDSCGKGSWFSTKISDSLKGCVRKLVRVSVSAHHIFVFFCKSNMCVWFFFFATSVLSPVLLLLGGLVVPWTSRFDFWLSWLTFFRLWNLDLTVKQYLEIEKAQLASTVRWY